MKTLSLSLVFAVIALALTGCPDRSSRFPAQAWENLTVTVETRPPVVQKGMNEFLVIVNEDQKRVANDLIIDLSIKGNPKKHQAIQDGHVGVYRRAVSVQDPATDILIVEIRRKTDQGVLEFPLNMQGKVNQSQPQQ